MDYIKLQKQLQEMSDLALKAKSEAGKDKPNRLTICNIACEKLSKLSEEIWDTVLRDSRNLRDNGGC